MRKGRRGLPRPILPPIRGAAPMIHQSQHQEKHLMQAPIFFLGCPLLPVHPLVTLLHKDLPDPFFHLFNPGILAFVLFIRTERNDDFKPRDVRRNCLLMN